MWNPFGQRAADRAARAARHAPGDAGSAGRPGAPQRDLRGGAARGLSVARVRRPTPDPAVGAHYAAHTASNENWSWRFSVGPYAVLVLGSRFQYVWSLFSSG